MVSLAPLWQAQSMDTLPTRHDLERLTRIRLTDRSWRQLRELVATAASLDRRHLNELVELSQAVLCLSEFRRGSTPRGPEPNSEIVRRLDVDVSAVLLHELTHESLPKARHPDRRPSRVL